MMKDRVGCTDVSATKDKTFPLPAPGFPALAEAGHEVQIFLLGEAVGSLMSKH